MNNTKNITKIVDMMLYQLGSGDIGMARTLCTEWYLGGVTKPAFNGHSSFKPAWKALCKDLSSELGLPTSFKGSVNIHINGGKVVRTDINPA